jgi:transcriptional regulator with XRE-family HTH domain
MTKHHIPITDLASLGAAIRARRQLARMTLDEAADLLGVSRRFLIELEHGRRRASIDKVLDVLHAFGLELMLLPRGKDGPGHVADR